MKRIALGLLAVLALVGCGCGHDSSPGIPGIRYIDGVKSVCIWDNPAVGNDRDLVCYPIIAESEPVTLP